MARLGLTREQILAHRRRVSALDERLPMGATSLRQAAWAGLTDSMPRAALLSIHARVEGVEPDTWEHGSLVQVWGPRFSVYVVAEQDRGVFTRGRHPDDSRGRERAEELAIALRDLLGDEGMAHADAGREIGGHPNRLRYATTTGTVVIRWDGARQPTIWSVQAADIAPDEARRELARRYLRVFGPARPAAFATWAGLRSRVGPATFDDLTAELVPVATPSGDAWIRAVDEASLRESAGDPAPARLLPSGDTYTLLWGDDRELLVPDASRRAELWTSRVWPGALLVAGEIAGVWRRQRGKVTIYPWRAFSAAERDDVEAEAATLPLPDVDEVVVAWEDA